MRIFSIVYGSRLPQSFQQLLTLSRILLAVYILVSLFHQVSGNNQRTTVPIPTIRRTQYNYTYTYTEGDLAVLYCAVDELGPRSLIWRKTTDPNPLTIGEMTYVTDDRFQMNRVPKKKEWNLFIKNIQLSDAGMYECQISTKQKYIRKLLRVFVLEKNVTDPDMKVFGPKRKKKGEDLVLRCNATGGTSAPNDIDWVKDDVKLVSEKSGRVHITKHISYAAMSIVSNLTIKNVTPQDEGTYVCRSSNDLVRNITVEIEGGVPNVKRMIPNQAPTTSRASTSSRSVVYVIVFVTCHCSHAFRGLVILLIGIITHLTVENTVLDTH